MAEFLDNTAISSALADLIKNSEERLYLISPYIHLTAINKKYLQNTDGNNLEIFVIHRSDAALKDEDKQFLQSLNNVTIYACDDLHAKCYLNETVGVISTMNLYEHSQTSNWEMGVKFSKEEDAKLFTDTLKEISLIVEASKKTSETKSAEKPHYQKQYTDRPKKQQTINPNLKKSLKKGFLGKLADSVFGEVGYCIRCGEMIDYRPEKPFCSECFASWAKFKNPDYREKYCHVCGDKAATTKVRPVCNECYNKHFRK
ncbi:phospholipase D-like domain-containing protein [Methanocalculus sp.]|uniref:phospholipase D-like domain-containing protein n=1 Tax=Methanocalculus sp. TaxID=2004547 RepID=UPI0026286CE2|nr:phospholipase D-like domain-containing protein [Methanocalculus sp.]MDG6251117.1 phospholipase D-like domain-containing protein [Methanocalculus sp.]